MTPDTSAVLTELAPDLWTATSPISVAGVPFTTRTTIARLGDGGLWIHSPSALTAELRAAVAALGEPRALVAPNLLHHLYLKDWQAAFAGQRIYGCPGLARKRADLAVDTELGNSVPAEWGDGFEQAALTGMPSTNEVVFLHRPSGTLIVTDTLYNVREAPTFRSRLFWKACGVWDKVGVSRLLRMTLRDQAAFARDLGRVLAWDFDRVTLAHGEVLESGGRAAFADAWSFLPIGSQQAAT